MNSESISSLLSPRLFACGILCFLSFITYQFLDISIYGTISIYLGSIWSLFALLILPLRFSVIVLFASLGSFYIVNLNSLFLLVLIAEFLTVLYAMRKANSFLVGISAYWFMIGFPMSAYLLYGAFSENIPTAIFTAVTISLNGFICGVFAMIAYWFVPSESQFKHFVPPPPKFANVVFELCIVSVILPIILATLVFTWRSTHETELIISKELQASALQIKNSTNSLLSKNIDMINSATKMAVEWRPNDENQKTLNTIAGTSRQIESMFVSNQTGDLQVVAPQKYAKIFKEMGNVNISERQYFQDTKAQVRPVVSAILEGRGIGNSDLIAVTSPIMRNGEFNGIGQVAIPLYNLVDVNVINTVEQKEVPVIVTDATGKIIYSSDVLRLTPKSTFEVQNTFHPFLRFTPVMQIFETAYIYINEENEHGWQIYTLAPPNKVFESIIAYFIYIAFTLFVSAVIIGLMANKLSTKITRPIVNLEDFIKNRVSIEQLEQESKISKEIANVTHNFVKAQKLSIDFQRKLESQVEEKTKELNQVNERLIQFSRTDALTGIYNRGAFDELAETAYYQSVRSKSPISMVLFDIDFFKKVNDTHGHQAGDTVIKEIAKTMAFFCGRNSDIVARYGGEEFAILMHSSESDKHLTYLREIIDTIEKKAIIHEDISLNVTISGGVVCIKHMFNESFEKVIALADEQLYLSKKTGRNKLSAIEI